MWRHIPLRRLCHAGEEDPLNPSPPLPLDPSLFAQPDSDSLLSRSSRRTRTRTSRTPPRRNGPPPSPMPPREGPTDGWTLLCFFLGPLPASRPWRPSPRRAPPFSSPLLSERRPDGSSPRLICISSSLHTAVAERTDGLAWRHHSCRMLPSLRAGAK